MQHVHLHHHLLVTAPCNPDLSYASSSKLHKLPSSITSQTLLHVARNGLRLSPAGSLPHTTIGTQPVEDFAEAAEQQHISRQVNPHFSHGTL